MLEFLQHGHVEAPEYNISYNEKHFSKGILFLSVCIHELEDGWEDKDTDGAYASNFQFS